MSGSMRSTWQPKASMSVTVGRNSRMSSSSCARVSYWARLTCIACSVPANVTKCIYVWVGSGSGNIVVAVTNTGLSVYLFEPSRQAGHVSAEDTVMRRELLPPHNPKHPSYLALSGGRRR